MMGGGEQDRLSLDYARALDANDALASFRERFYLPEDALDIRRVKIARSDELPGKPALEVRSIDCPDLHPIDLVGGRSDGSPRLAAGSSSKRYPRLPDD